MNTTFSPRRMALSSLFAALMALCAWISVPVSDIAFTLQTLGVFLALGLLGGKWGTVSILTYLLLGAVGLPVFSAFRGGPGILLGATGGYLLGFLLAGLGYWAVTALFGPRASLFGMLLGQLLCYGFGTGWYFLLYARGSSLTAVLTLCVVPYLLPDALKIALAHHLTWRLRRTGRMSLSP